MLFGTPCNFTLYIHNTYRYIQLHDVNLTASTGSPASSGGTDEVTTTPEPTTVRYVRGVQKFMIERFITKLCLLTKETFGINICQEDRFNLAFDSDIPDDYKSEVVYRFSD